MIPRRFRCDETATLEVPVSKGQGELLDPLKGQLLRFWVFRESDHAKPEVHVAPDPAFSQIFVVRDLQVLEDFKPRYLFVFLRSNDDGDDRRHRSDDPDDSDD